MSDDLTQSLDLDLLGVEGTEMQGTVELARLPRLCAELDDARGSAQVRLSFEREPGGLRMLEGQIRAELALTCQRCLKPLRLPVDTRFHLALLQAGDDPDLLPSGVDPVVLGSTQVNVLELLEDELLLCLPIAPRHRGAERCVAPQRGAGSTFGDADLERQSPFAVLRDLPVKQPPEKP